MKEHVYSPKPLSWGICHHYPLEAVADEVREPSGCDPGFIQSVLLNHNYLSHERKRNISEPLCY